MILRDTKARWRNKVKVIGVEGGLWPLVIAGIVSLVFVFDAMRAPSFLAYGLAVMPFIGTWLFMWIFLTGKRPYWARDVVLVSVPNSHSVSAQPPIGQPIHPAMEKRQRAARTN